MTQLFACFTVDKLIIELKREAKWPQFRTELSEMFSISLLSYVYLVRKYVFAELSRTAFSRLLRRLEKQ